MVESGLELFVTVAVSSLGLKTLNRTVTFEKDEIENLRECVALCRRAVAQWTPTGS
jgi:hypothetical protein